MKLYFIFADAETERISVSYQDRSEADPQNVLETCQTSQYAYGQAAYLNGMLGSDSHGPFLARVQRAVAQHQREIAAIHQALKDGESPELAIEQRRHPAVLAALATRPK